MFMRILNRLDAHILFILFHAEQINLLTRNICLADFFGYQPNLHVKWMYFDW